MIAIAIPMSLKFECHCFLGTPLHPYRPNTQILMHTSANDLFLMFFTASQRLTPSEKSFCRGYAKFNTKERSRKILRSIATNEAHGLALRHSTLFDGSILAQDPSSRDSSSPTLKHIPFSVTSSPTHPDVSGEPLASLRIGIIAHNGDTVFAGRVNNVATLLEANRQFLSRTNYSLPTDPDNRALIDAKSRISPDSMIGSSTKIGERATITRSVIGRHCVIGKTSRVVGCMLLDHCVVGEGAKLEGCILGRNTKVGAKAELVRSLTQAGYEVDAGATIRNEKLEVSDWTAGPEGRSFGEMSSEEEESDEE